MICDPYHFYPFAEYNYQQLIHESGIAFGAFFIGLIAIISTRKYPDSKRMPTLLVIYSRISILIGILGLFFLVAALPYKIRFYKLAKNFKATITEVTSEQYQPRAGRRSEKYIVRHHFNFQGRYQETTSQITPEDRKGIFKNLNTHDGKYWIYYNPEDPDIFLVDFRNTSDKIEPVCGGQSFSY